MKLILEIFLIFVADGFSAKKSLRKNEECPVPDKAVICENRCLDDGTQCVARCEDQGR